MADPENTAPEGEEVAMFGNIGQALGGVAGQAAGGIGTVIEGSGVIEATRSLGEALRASDMLNSVGDLLEDVQGRVLDGIEEENVIEAEPPQELQASAADDGQVASADADGVDDAYDDTAEA